MRAGHARPLHHRGPGHRSRVPELSHRARPGRLRSGTTCSTSGAFEPVGDELVFDSPSGGGDLPLPHRTVRPLTRSHGSSTSPIRTAERAGCRRAGAPSPAGTSCRSRWPQSQRRRYRVVRDSSITSLAAPSVTTARATSRIDLRSPDLGADYLVLFYDDFAAAAESLVTWRAAAERVRDRCRCRSRRSTISSRAGAPIPPRSATSCARPPTTGRKQPDVRDAARRRVVRLQEHPGRAGAGQPGTCCPRSRTATMAASRVVRPSPPTTGC